METHFQIETKTGTDLNLAADLLLSNEVVAIPTETVYGLAGNAFNEQAVLSIFKAKNRPHFNPLIVHTHSLQAVDAFVQAIPEAAYRLAEAFWPGPLTLLLEKKAIIPDLVTAGHHKVAIRIPAHPLTLSLLKQLPFPVAAPSANRFGYVSPTTASHVFEGLSGIIPYILDGGPCAVGVESTIVDFEADQIIVRRKGGIGAERIAESAGTSVIMRTHASEHPVAPGQLKSHYATRTPLFTGPLHGLLPRFKNKKVVLLEFGKQIEADVFGRYNLSAKGDIDEAATCLFAVMREADAAGADVILATLIPEYGLGAAVNDRLKRAAVPHNA